VIEGVSMSHENRDSHLKFIEGNWSIIAAFALDRYRQEGRGCIVVDSRESDSTPTICSNLGESIGYYLNISSIDKNDIDTIRMVNNYTPEKEAVIVILRKDGGTSSYRMCGPISPEEALKRLKYEL